MERQPARLARVRSGVTRPDGDRDPAISAHWLPLEAGYLRKSGSMQFLHQRVFDPSVRRKAPSTGLNSSIPKATRGSSLVAHGLRTNRARREAKFHASMLSVEKTALRSFLRGPRGPSQTPFGRRPSSVIRFPSGNTRTVTCGVPRTASITASSLWNRRMALTATTYGWSSAPYRDSFFSRASRISSYDFVLIALLFLRRRQHPRLSSVRKFPGEQQADGLLFGFCSAPPKEH